MLNKLELKLVREMVARRGADAVTLAVAMACSDVGIDHVNKGNDDMADGWMEFARRLALEYNWCKKHLY